MINRLNQAVQFKLVTTLNLGSKKFKFQSNNRYQSSFKMLLTNNFIAMTTQVSCIQFSSTVSL